MKIYIYLRNMKVVLSLIQYNYIFGNIEQNNIQCLLIFKHYRLADLLEITHSDAHRLMQALILCYNQCNLSILIITLQITTIAVLYQYYSTISVLYQYYITVRTCWYIINNNGIMTSFLFYKSWSFLSISCCHQKLL